MPRYADLVTQAFADCPGVSLSRVTLARPPGSRTRRLLAPLRTLLHHGGVRQRARRLGGSSGADVDLFHLVDGSHGYVAPLLMARPTVVTVHDVIPALQAHGRFATGAPGRLSRLVIDAAVRGAGQASRIVCDSSSSRRDLEELAPHAAQRFQVVFPPLEPGFFEHGPGGTTGETGPYVFHLGNNAFYKNRSGVLRVFAAIGPRSGLRLVMAGPPPPRSLRDLASELDITDRVEFLVDPSDKEVRRHYAQATLLLFPSIYEGFGWPPLEAMASGCPVVCSDAGSLAEVVGDAALTCPADDVDGLAARCRRVLDDTRLADDLRGRGRQRAAQFSLQRFRDELLAVYREAAGMRE